MTTTMLRFSLSSAVVVALVATDAGTVYAQQRAGDVVTESRRIAVAGGDSVEVDMGRLFVPENRAKAESRLIELAFLRVKSPVPNPGPPLFYLAGGPGGSATGQVNLGRGLSERWSWYLSICDLVFLDQRGAGRSNPNLLHIAPSHARMEAFRDAAVAREVMVAAAREGAEKFRTEGVDLDGYTTVESADDIDAARQALGYERINLWGFSYGTHLGLATIRRHGDRIANAVLMGVEGPDHTFKLPSTMDTQWRKIVRLAARDPELRKHIPDLDALLDRVLTTLDREPLVVEVRDPVGVVRELPVGRFGLLWIMRFDIGDMSDIPAFPRLLSSIDRGDPSMLAWFVQKRVQLLFGSQVMSVVMDAASGASPERRARIARESAESRFGDVVNFPHPAIGEAIGVRDLGPAYRAPIVSDVRTLFVSGDMDFNTPPYQAEEVRWGFTDASHVIVENAGHEQPIQQLPVQLAIAAFFRGEEVPDTRVDAGPIRFVPIEGYNPEVTHPSVPRP